MHQRTVQQHRCLFARLAVEKVRDSSMFQTSHDALKDSKTCVMCSIAHAPRDFTSHWPTEATWSCSCSCLQALSEGGCTPSVALSPVCCRITYANHSCTTTKHKQLLTLLPTDIDYNMLKTSLKRPLNPSTYVGICCFSVCTNHPYHVGAVIASSRPQSTHPI